MSYRETSAPECHGGTGKVELLIESRERDLGGFSVRRILPSARRRMVGPFIFFDHIGPASFPPGKGIQVRPHPHIGLATVTYLFDGEIMHRDSLGCVQPIRAGAVNLMTAGRGIVHSERAGDDLDRDSTLHGIQSWMALPDDKLEIEPAFQHYPADALPEIRLGNAEIRVIMGGLQQVQSPVTQHSPTLYLECRLPSGETLTLPTLATELAIYVVRGAATVARHTLVVGQMAVLESHSEVRIDATQDAMLMIIGGEPVGPRHIWWNFVAATQQRMEQAKDDWRKNRFGSVPGDDEFIPLPD